MTNQSNNLKPINDHPDKKRVCIPEVQLNRKHHVRQEIIDVLANEAPDMIQEIIDGLEAVADYEKTVTIFGSARTEPGTKYYELARQLAHDLGKQDYMVVTGGGPGIMQAGNQGSKEATGTSVGFNIELPFEQVINPYATHGVSFKYFFTRKLAMNFSGAAYVCFPGGFGTMDEFFQILTLVQTKKVQQIPIILFGSDFWQPIMDYSKNVLLDQFQTISPEDLNLFQIIDSVDECVEVIKNAPARVDFYK